MKKNVVKKQRFRRIDNNKEEDCSIQGKHAGALSTKWQFLGKKAKTISSCIILKLINCN